MKALLVSLLTVCMSLAFASIGEPPDTIIKQLPEVNKSSENTQSYSAADAFDFSFELRGGAVYKVLADATFNEQNIDFATTLIATATGYGQDIAGPLKEFLSTRLPELAGQGPLNIAVVSYVMNLDVTGDRAPYDVKMVLSLQEIPEEAFPTVRRTIGPADAKYVVREFSDFECPYCAQFAANALPQIKKDLLSRGDVRFEFHHLPLQSIHPNAFQAAEAAECVAVENNDDAFWTYHDALFERQQAWEDLSDPSAYFVRLAQDVGLKNEALASCLSNREQAAVVDAGYQTAQQLRIGSTPSVFVNGFKVANFNNLNSYYELFDLIDTFNSGN